MDLFHIFRHEVERLEQEAKRHLETMDDADAEEPGENCLLQLQQAHRYACQT